MSDGTLRVQTVEGIYLIVVTIMREVLQGLKSLWTCVTDSPQITNTLWLEEHSGKIGSHKNNIFV